MSYGIMGSLFGPRTGGTTGFGTGDHTSRTPTSYWGLTPTSSTLNGTVKNDTPDPTPALLAASGNGVYGVRPTDSSVVQAVTPTRGLPAAMGDSQWGILDRNSSIVGDLSASNQRNQQIQDALSKMQPVNSGVSAFSYNGPNAVQQARMQAGQDPNGGGQWNSQDPRNAVLNAYNPTSQQQPGLGGSMPPPQPAPQPAPVSGPYNGGAWTATGNPYSAPGTIMGKTVPMTPEIQNILAQGRVAGG